MSWLQIIDADANTSPRQIVLREPRFTVGRAEDNDVVLNADSGVSRRHAVLETENQHWVVRDLDSRNGTRVNDVKVFDQATLGPTDDVRIGRYVLRIRPDEPGDTETADSMGIAGEAIARYRLSAREVEVLRLVAQGATNRRIAELLIISAKTVDSHLERIRDKVGLRRRPDLVRFVLDHQLDK